MSITELDRQVGPQHPLLTSEEFDAIKAEILDAPWNDPARFPECLTIAMEALRDIACGVGDPYMPAHAASQTLRQMLQRTKFGGPLEDMARGEFV